MSGVARYRRGQVLRVQIQGHREPVSMVCIERTGMNGGGGLVLMIDRQGGEMDRALDALNARSVMSDSRIDELVESAIQGHASTRDAMRWLAKQITTS